MADFSPALAFLLLNECDDRAVLNPKTGQPWGKRIADVGGGFSHRADDKGGGTVYGLSTVIRFREGFVPADFKITSFADADLLETTLETATVLWKRIWDRYGLARLNSQDCATKLFDALANMSPYWAVICAQKAANAYGAEIEVDGDLGPKTVTAINKTDSQYWLRAMCLIQLDRYMEIAALDPTQRWNLDHLWRARAAACPK